MAFVFEHVSALRASIFTREIPRTGSAACRSKAGSVTEPSGACRYEKRAEKESPMGKIGDVRTVLHIS